MMGRPVEPRKHVAICVLFMVAELVGGYIANSIAIMSDAAHLFSDLIGFCISIGSIILSTKAPTQEFSFGFGRVQILGALDVVLL